MTSREMSSARSAGQRARRIAAMSSAAAPKTRPRASMTVPELNDHAATIACRASRASADERERGSLRVPALNDPASAGHLERAVEDLPAFLLHPLGRGAGTVDVEVIIPAGLRNLFAFGHHAVHRLTAQAEELIGAHRAHVDRARLGPAEQPRIELEGGGEIAGIKLAPAGMARRAGRGGHVLVRRLPLDEREGRALRIGDDGKAPDAGNVLRFLVDAAAELDDPAGGRGDVIDRPVAHPSRPPARRPPPRGAG